MEEDFLPEGIRELTVPVGRAKEGPVGTQEGTATDDPMALMAKPKQMWEVPFNERPMIGDRPISSTDAAALKEITEETERKRQTEALVKAQRLEQERAQRMEGPVTERRMQDMTPAPDYGLPEFGNSNLAMNNAIDLARAITNQENRVDLRKSASDSNISHMIGDVWNAAKAPGDAYAGRLDPNSDEAIKRSFDLAGILTLGQAPKNALAPHDPNTIGIFGGMSSPSAEIADLQKAIRLQTKGQTPEQIWYQTGWDLTHPDKMPRFEVPDYSSKLKAFPERGAHAPLGQVLDHPELYTAYPELKNVHVFSDPNLIGSGTHAYYQPEMGNSRPYIAINPSISAREAHSAVLHEIQHWVQQREKFAAGANSKMYELPADKLTNLVTQQRLLQQAHDIQKLIGMGMSEERAHAAMRDTWGNNFMRESMQFAKEPPERLVKNLNDLREILDRAKNQGYDGYQRTMGEVEARNVQYRFDNYMPEHLRMTPPSHSQSVPNERQIYTSWQDMGAKSEPMLNAVDIAKQMLPRDVQPSGLYSHGVEAAKALPQKVGTPEQMKAMLTKAGTKPDEFKWAKWDEATAGKTKITKEEAEAVLREGLPKVEETILKEPTFNDLPKGIQKEALEVAQNSARAAGKEWENLTPAQRRPYFDEAMEYVRENSVENGGELAIKEPKYKKYLLPGGDNYREVLLRLPSEWKPNIEEKNGRFGFTGPDGKYRDYWSKADAEQASRSMLRHDATQYTSSHWDEPNVLAHIRMTDRMESQNGLNPKKVLHVEELQSDWAQQGRKQGFKNSGDYDKLLERALDTRKKLWDYHEASPSITTEQMHDDIERIINGQRPAHISRNSETAPLIDNFAEAYGKLKKNNDGIEPAPYVTNTSAWTSLALKRVLKEAVDGGYDKIIWTPGKQQSERYSGHAPEGMQGFYDQIVPAQLSALVKKLDPDARVMPKSEPVLPPKVQQAQEKFDSLQKAIKSTEARWQEIASENHKNVRMITEMTGVGPSYSYHQWKDAFKDNPAAVNIWEQLMKNMRAMEEFSDSIKKMQQEQTKFSRALNSHAKKDPTAGFPYLEITPKMREEIRKGLPAYKAGGAVIDDTGANVPEHPDTLFEQVFELAKGGRQAVMFPNGTVELPLFPGMKRTVTPRGVFHYNPKTLDDDAIHHFSAMNRENELLDMGPFNKDDIHNIAQKTGETIHTLTERSPHGKEVKSVAGTPSTMGIQMEHLDRTKGEGNTLHVETPEETVSRRA